MLEKVRRVCKGKEAKRIKYSYVKSVETKRLQRELSKGLDKEGCRKRKIPVRREEREKENVRRKEGKNKLYKKC